MQLSFTQYAIMLFLVFLIAGSLFSCVDVVPHTENGVAKQASSIEGFEAMDKPLDYNTQNTQQENADAPDMAMVHGFKPLFNGINNNGEKLDKFASVKGDLYCEASYGISNSRGPLCFDEETIKLLRTRGGNSASGPSEIGA
jgi:hypothetical protein